jgi:hypothetical protein
VGWLLAIVAGLSETGSAVLLILAGVTVLYLSGLTPS